MLVHPWDAPLDDAEWRDWLLAGHDFGELIAPGRDRDLPVVVPTHFLFDGERTVRLHLARPNPVWAALEENPRALLTVIGDYTFIPSTWGADPATPPDEGIATSYYATVQLQCDVRLVDDPHEKVEILRAQLGHHQPEGGFRELSAEEDMYARRLPGIRGIELSVPGVRAKFKVGGNKQPDHRTVIAGRLADRDAPGDAAARANLLRRMPS